MNAAHEKRIVGEFKVLFIFAKYSNAAFLTNEGVYGIENNKITNMMNYV